MKKTGQFRVLIFLSIIFLMIGSIISTSQAAITTETIFQGKDVIVSERESNEYRPAIAYNSVHDEYLVVWENLWSGGHHDIYAQRVRGDGQLLSWFAVASNSYSQMNPAVAYDPINDRYLVVFSYDYYGNGSDWDINGRFIPWNGPSSSFLDFGISTWDSDQMRPEVAYALSAQEFLVTWTNAPDGQPTYISARRVFAGGGFPPGDGFTVSSGSDNRDYQDVAYNLARNEYLITWDVDKGGSNLDIAGIRLNASGIALLGGDPYAIGEFSIAGWPDDEERPAVAACSNADQYLVTWQSDQGTGGSDTAIYGRYLSGEAVPGGVVMISDTSSPQLNPDISCDFTGKRYLLVWQDKYVGGEFGIWGRLAYPNLDLKSEFEIMGPRYLADREFPAVIGGRSTFFTVWEHDRDLGTNKDIHGKLLGYFAYLPTILK